MKSGFYDPSRKKPVICSSTFMSAEEIAQERAASGWNPYEGEELPQETKQKMQETKQEELQGMPPVFRGSGYEERIEEQKESEKDLRTLQSMYPEAAKVILPYIEELCDKLEYEGSMMFDRFPDQTTLYQMQDLIRDQVKEQFPDDVIVEEPDEILTMQYRGRRNPPGKNWLADMIRVLLLQEMHHRRGRHRCCSRMR